MVLPTCPVIEHSKLAGLLFFLQVTLECKLVISASSLSPLRVANSLVLWIRATPKTTSRVLSPVNRPKKANDEYLQA
jgi:hypothetical protein